MLRYRQTYTNVYAKLCIYLLHTVKYGTCVMLVNTHIYIYNTDTAMQGEIVRIDCEYIYVCARNFIHMYTYVRIYVYRQDMKCN